MVKLNEKGFQFARQLLEEGKIIEPSSWEPPSVDVENQYIEQFGIEAFSKWHLGVDTEANEETKGAWKFIFTSDFENLDRRGLVAIRQRSAQQGCDDIFEAAGKLLEAWPEKQVQSVPNVVLEKVFQSETKAVGGNVVDFVITTEDIDRYGEKVLARGCEFENFLRNPIVLFAHDWQLPVGRCVGLRIKEDKIEARTELFPDLVEEPRAKTAINLALNGILRAVSVGFVPKEWKYEQNEGREVKVYTKWELVEYSLVAVPANPNALAKSATTEKAGRVISQANLERLEKAVQSIETALALIRELIDSATPSEVPSAVINEQYENAIIIDFQTFLQNVKQYRRTQNAKQN